MSKPLLTPQRDALTRFQIVREGCRPPAPPPEPSPEAKKLLARIDVLFAHMNAALQEETPDNDKP